MIKIALAGNPNCGKTTLFNDLTGSSQYVGNWPGVTVEKKEGKLKGRKDEVTIVDLPGIYSLSPYTLEEVVSRDYLINEKPDLIINIIDGTNIERNLYLTTQLLETGIPVIVALNMMDLVEKNGDKIDVKAMSQALGVPIVELTALTGKGKDDLINTALKRASGKAAEDISIPFDKTVEECLGEIVKLTAPMPQVAQNSRWFSIKLFERDERVLSQLDIPVDITNQIEGLIENVEDTLDDDSESIITDQRYEHISAIVSRTVKKKQLGMTTSDKIDRIVTNRFLALPIFLVIMGGVYYLAMSSIGGLLTDWVNDTLFGEIIMGGATTFLESVGAADWLMSLVVDGIIGGVGAVLGFVPQIMILFLLISILEDCGYMARVAFIMDRIFRRFGLSGKSFIPMLIGSGCSVPAIMASRTIEQDRDRKMTIILTPFIPCSAKMPIFILIASALFPYSVWVAPSMYFLGIVMVIISGIILKKTKLFSGDPAPFVMELPPYHMPGAKGVLIHMWERGKSFIVKAGTVIFVGSAVIWFLSSFNTSMEMVDAGDSMLAAVGNVIAPIFAPLGFGNWQSAVAIVSGLLAKENVVATFGILFGIAEATEESSELFPQVATMFTTVSAYAFMAFNLLAAPCLAAIGATKREMGSWKWTLIAIGFQTALAYVVAFIINQVGSAIFLGASFTPTIIIAIVLAVIIGVMAFQNVKKNKKSAVKSSL